VLEKAGLISRRKHGRTNYLTLSPGSSGCVNSARELTPFQRLKTDPFGWFGRAEVGQALLRAGQDVRQFVRGVAGVGQVSGCIADGRAGVGAVVGSQAAGVVFGVQPLVELIEELREATGEEDEFGDEPVELGRPAEGACAAGAVVELADGLGGPVGQVQCDGGGCHCSPAVLGAGTRPRSRFLSRKLSPLRLMTSA
jgi:hypothetical protein